MKQCPQCNSTFEDAQSFCLVDGTPLVDTADLETKKSVENKNKNWLWVVFSLFLIGLAVSVIAGIFSLFAAKPKVEVAQAANSNMSVPNPIPEPSVTPAFTPTPQPTITPSPLNSVTPSPETSPLTKATGNQNISNIPQNTNSNLTLPQTSALKVEDHEIVFNLQQCKKSGTTITCDFSLTNSGADRRFKLVARKSNLFDELGNGYKGQNAQLANQSENEPRIDFISGVTTKAQIAFEKIEPNAAKITLLTIMYDVGDDYGVELKFRNVPLSIGK
jgi:cbb3-type cytochrome oxidase subunit 3